MKQFALILLLISFAVSAEAQDTILFADTEPEYPGGIEAMNKFIKTNIFYPEEAKKNGEQGNVYVEFVVNASGSVTDVKVVKSVSPLLDAEAVRVISMMPNWKPGTHDGKPCSIRYTVPIIFSITSTTSTQRIPGSK